MSARKTTISLVAAAGLLAAASIAQSAFAAHEDWTIFGSNVAHTSAPTAAMGITAANVGSLKRQRIKIDGTVDASAIYLHGVKVKGRKHDVFFVTTTYGKTLAIDADSGKALWEFTPPDYRHYSGSSQITTATPVADPDRRYIYAAAPDGIIRKLAVADGRVVWHTAITKLPSHEKIASPLTFFHGRVIAVTGGYVGDIPPYQGHVAILKSKTGKLAHVWNALCSNRHQLMKPDSCAEKLAAIWGRAGAVINSKGDIFIATGNARWNGRNDWGDSVIELNPRATRILGNYTPSNTEQLNETDGDLGSSSPVLLGGGLIAQGGKDRHIALLDWRKLRGKKPHRGGEADRVATPGGAPLFTQPAVLHQGSTTWLFAADGNGTSAWTVSGNKLHRRWHNSHAGTSPVAADGMLFVYDPGGGLRVYKARSGKEIANLDCGSGHWNSPIVVDGRIALPEGDANSHRTSGVLDIWRVH
jgi:outer membrane protein assembly factor BamB